MWAPIGWFAFEKGFFSRRIREPWEGPSLQGQQDPDVKASESAENKGPG